MTMLSRWRRCLDVSGKGATVALTIPLLDPGIGTQRFVHVLEVLADLAAITLYLAAPMKVNVRLVAVLGLVGVREARVERSRLEGQLHFLILGGHCI